MGGRIVNRHTWREVRRQLRESGAAGLVAVMLVALSTAWGGGLWLVHRWLAQELLADTGAAKVVATGRTEEGVAAARSALLDRFPGITAELLAPRGVQEQLGRWFPELSPMLLSLPDSSFPTLLNVTVSASQEESVVTLLRTQQGISLVESSRTWQRHVAEVSRRFMWIGSVAAFVLLGGCCVVVLLVIRLLVLSHADEISIMRLIGAHEGAIRLPYVVCGSMLGIVGGLLGLTLLVAVVLQLRAIIPAVGLAVRLAVTLPLAGCVVGVLGATLGLAALPEEP